MKTATYTGPSIRVAFSGGQYRLLQGQRVLVVEVVGDHATVQYDPTDQRHHDCDLGLGSEIRGVPMRDLTPIVELHTFVPGQASYGQEPEDCFYCWGAAAEHEEVTTMTMNDVWTVFVEPDEADPQEIIESLQRMISAGQWSLEGHTGRTMFSAIESGHCVLGPRPAKDYWGNTIPARGQVKSGTQGSIAYANNLRRERGDKLITGSYLRRVERGIR